MKQMTDMCETIIGGLRYHRSNDILIRESQGCHLRILSVAFVKYIILFCNSESIIEVESSCEFILIKPEVQSVIC